MTKYPNSTLNNGWKKDNLCKHKCSSVGISDDTYKKKLERAIEGITLFTFANPDDAGLSQILDIYEYCFIFCLYSYINIS